MYHAGNDTSSSTKELTASLANKIWRDVGPLPKEILPKEIEIDFGLFKKQPVPKLRKAKQFEQLKMWGLRK